MSGISKVGVIGAGTMGNGIAQACAVAGVDVVMVDVADAAVQRGVAAIAGSLERLVKKDKLTADAKAQALARVHGHDATTRRSPRRTSSSRPRPRISSSSSKILRKVDALREARGAPRVEHVVDLDHVARGRDVAARPLPRHALLQPGADDGAGRDDPRPADVRGHRRVARRPSPKRLGKTPIVVKNSPGFVVNRILCPMLNEAIFALQEGLATAEDIDNGMKLGCNHPIGPLALADMVGLDVLLAVMNVFYADFNDPKYRPAPLLKEMVAAGYLGRKTRRGFYRYD